MVCGTDPNYPECRGKAKYLSTDEQYREGIKVNKVYVCDVCGSMFRIEKGLGYVEEIK